MRTSRVGLSLSQLEAQNKQDIVQLIRNNKIIGIGCPYNSKCEEELQIMNKYEPLLYKAAQNIFGQSYEYKKKYLAFKKQKQKENKNGN